MRLALAAGRPEEVEVLARRLSSRELAEWDAFERIEGGIGTRAVQVAVAQLTATLAEIHRDPKKRARPFTAGEFLPFIERKAEGGLTPKALRALLGGRVKKKER